MHNTREIPPSVNIVKEAEKINPQLDLNGLHSKTYDILKKYRLMYYKKRVGELLSRDGLKTLQPAIRLAIKKELLKPVSKNDIEYSNFMEEVVRRMSQTFQVLSGNIAELCVERELNKAGLQLSVHYVKRAERTDFIVYHPQKTDHKEKHRVEVKNVKLRERGMRGLAFDGDSMIGFFDAPSEFTESNVQIIDDHCKKAQGYCYVPPETLAHMKWRGKRFKSNMEFATDMENFVLQGFM